MKRSKMFSLAVSAVAALMIGGFALPVNAAENEQDKIQQLVELNPGVTYEEVQESIEEMAHRKNSPVDAVLDSSIAEARAHKTDIQQSRIAATVMVGPARHAGDVFYSPASSSGIVFGHSGIYESTDFIIEAPGEKVGNGKSRWTHRSNVNVARGGEIQYVDTSQYTRNLAASKAHQYIGRDYSWRFWDNRHDTDKMNCSQLVWASYWYSSGIDLDGDGGSGVYPSDIRDSPWTVTYRWI